MFVCGSVVSLSFNDKVSLPDWALAVNMHFKCIPKDNLIFK